MYASFFDELEKIGMPMMTVSTPPPPPPSRSGGHMFTSPPIKPVNSGMHPLIRLGLLKKMHERSQEQPEQD